MVEKTKGIVLHFTRYSDSSGIVNVLTERFGRQAYMVRGVGTGSRGNRKILYQPLMIIDIEASHKEGREIQNIKSVSLSHVPVTLHGNVSKGSVAIFLAEVLNHSVREVMPDPGLFEYVEQSVVALDTDAGNHPAFHLAFMAGLTRYLGFGPTPPPDDGDYLFDIRNGLFTFMPPAGGLYMNHHESRVFRMLLEEPGSPAVHAGLTVTMRRSMLERLIAYYEAHIPGFKNLKSARILREVFS